MRDAPRRRDDYRVEEWVAHGEAPEQVDRLARAQARGRFCVCAIHGVDEPDAPLRAGYKALGYRLMTSEALMVHSLQRIPRVKSPATVRRITTPELAERAAKAERARPIRAELMAADSPMRCYVALLAGEVVGRVRSIVVGDATWCSSMYVEAKHRRKGIGRSLLCQMLRDDRAAGATAAVLLASHVGAKLYAACGYDHIGTLLLFTPRRKQAK
jgi:GNAT superfamily N-acetyltransferase